MPGLPPALARLISEPPPEFAYEISESGVALVRTAHPAHVSFHGFAPGVVTPSPLVDNVLAPEAFLEGLRAVTPPASGRKRRQAAVLLPDFSARVSVLDFDKIPDKPDELEALVRFRMKKSVPFEIDTAALSYWVQPPLPSAPSTAARPSLVAAVAPFEVIAGYEAPFRTLNLHPGFITLSFLAAMELAPVSEAISMFAKLSGRILTVLVLRSGTIQLIRSIEVESGSLAEIAQDLFPTVVYTEDHFGSRAVELLICGFGDLEREAVPFLAAQLELPVRALSTRDAGLAGYILGTGGERKAAA